MNNRNEIIEKYIKELSNLRAAMHVHPQISIDKFCKSKNLNRSLSQLLQKHNVIENQGHTGGNAYWVWKAGDPNEKMVNTILKLRDNSKPKPTIKRQRRSYIKYSETRLLFGLIKLRTTYHYNR